MYLDEIPRLLLPCVGGRHAGALPSHNRLMPRRDVVIAATIPSYLLLMSPPTTMPSRRAPQLTHGCTYTFKATITSFLPGYYILLLFAAGQLTPIITLQ